MELLPIDEAKTKLQAEETLMKYREQRGFANMPVSPKITSAWGDGTAASTNERDPYALERLQRQERAQSFVRFIDWAISALPKRSHQQLLKVRYCDDAESDHPDMTAMMRLEISSSTYTDRKAKALLAVAHYLNCVVREKAGTNPA